LPADDSKIGTDWSDDELDAIVADYFAMLEAELSKRPYVKRRHNAALQEKIGRTQGAIEFKHQNISAVLEELGEPWIPGYKPMRNYQEAIFPAIERYLSRNPAVPYEQLPPAVLHAAEDSGNMLLDPTGVFIEPPAPAERIHRPPALERLVRKFDPVERDHRNRKLGKAGEEFVLQIERKRLQTLDRPDLARKIRWVSAEDGDGAGYDILSFEPNGQERLVEVKTTNGSAKTPFFLTRNEHAVANERAASWQLYRLHLFAQTPRIFTIKPPLEAHLHLHPQAWRASLR
jgi:hypothetical protein